MEGNGKVVIVEYSSVMGLGGGGSRGWFFLILLGFYTNFTKNTKMETKEILKKLNEMVSSGIKKTKIEDMVGFPKNGLSAILTGKKELPDKWVPVFEKFLADGMARPVQQEDDIKPGIGERLLALELQFKELKKLYSAAANQIQPNQGVVKLIDHTHAPKNKFVEQVQKSNTGVKSEVEKMFEEERNKRLNKTTQYGK